MQIELQPDRVRTLCAELGFTITPPLSQQQIRMITVYKPGGIHAGVSRTWRRPVSSRTRPRS